MDEPLSDEELVRRANAGEPSALGALYVMLAALDPDSRPPTTASAI